MENPSFLALECLNATTCFWITLLILWILFSPLPNTLNNYKKKIFSLMAGVIIVHNLLSPIYNQLFTQMIIILRNMELITKAVQQRATQISFTCLLTSVVITTLAIALSTVTRYSLEYLMFWRQRQDRMNWTKLRMIQAE